MKVRIFLMNGGLITWDVPATPEWASFNFVSFAKTVRADGFFLLPEMYIPHDKIAAMGLESPTPGAPGISMEGAAPKGSLQ